MYLRHSSIRKNGKTHTYWRLVRSVRRNGKVVQETVAQLGELDAEGRAKASALARQVMGRSEQMSLFEDRSAISQNVRVRLDQIRVERGRGFGHVWMAWTLWCALGLDKLCERVMSTGRETVPWPTMAAVLVIARLCEPSSELHIAEDWYRKTALEDILGLPVARVNDDRLYRALDRLLACKEQMQIHLKERLGELFNIDYDLLLYDVTSTYFEGEAKGIPIAKRGYSRDKRPDCKQVCIALVVTRQGIPLGYEVFEGNRTDVTTVEEIVTTMESRYGLSGRVWVMDRGMTSADNISWLQRTGRQYLVGASKTELKNWSKQLLDRADWNEIREGLEVKLCQGPGGVETFILCRSADRKLKEQAMHERFGHNIEDGLTSLGQRIVKSKKLLDRGEIERQIGRLLERNSRAAGRYQISVVDDSSCRSGLRLSWSVREEWRDWADINEGCYVLRSNISDWSAETLWKTYIQLTEAESAFRIHKSELCLRPVWHQKEGRAKAHILVCFLAYVLWKTLEQWQQRAGLGNSPRTVLDELSTVQSVDVVLPTTEPSNRELRIRCVVRPDPAQAAILDRLGLRLPERLRLAPQLAAV